ncbi:MAG TPA: LLM class flavin-dependent oxidoreductase, partial [Chitinophagaceae bacterium]|nr:LLM class flavin-dependent oxidoreductase [Chitinophagaceae bacterium]
NSSPQLWALTSSGESAYLAAHFGIGLSYAQFINPLGGPEAIKLYRQRFIPSDDIPAPVTNVGIFVFCSDNEEKVDQAKALMEYRFLSFEKGEFNKFYNYADIKDYNYTVAEQQRLAYHRNRYISGTPQYVKEKLEELATTFDTNEIVVATFAETKDDRLQSYRLLAETFL